MRELNARLSGRLRWRSGRLRLLLTAVALVTLYAATTSTQRATFEDLQHGTGWIFIGLTATFDERMLYTAPVVVEEDAPFEHRFKVPRAGQIVELVRDEELLIRNFRTRGEEDRLISPNRSPERAVDGDRTGIILPAESRFRLAVVETDTPRDNGSIRIYGRLEAVPSSDE